MDEENREKCEEVNSEYWFQRLLAIGLKIGLSKKEILDDYYPGELEIVLQEYNKLHNENKENNDPSAIEAAGF